MHKRTLVALACAVGLAVSATALAASVGNAEAAAKPAIARAHSCDAVGIPVLFQFAIAVFGTNGADLQIYRGTLLGAEGRKLTLRVPRTLCARGGIKPLLIPSGASVRRDGSASSLGELQRGDTVAVILSSHGDYVLAGDARYMASR
jgi:hypothetical protein